MTPRPSLFELEQLAVEEALAHDGACCDLDDVAAVRPPATVHERCGQLYTPGDLPLHLESECPCPPAEVDVQRFLDGLEQRPASP